MIKLIEQWRSIAIGVVIVIVGAGLKFIISDMVTQRVKLENLPSPPSIALKSDVQDKFNDLNSKLEKQTQETSQHLDRIEQKIDRLMLTMIAKSSKRDPYGNIQGLTGGDEPADAPSVKAPKPTASKTDPNSVR
jgi:hypothetical protein